MVQLSHLYVTTGKSIALTKRIFVSKVMSLLFNTLPRWVITFLPKSKHLLISWQTDKSIAISNQNQHKDTQLPQGNLFLFIVISGLIFTPLLTPKPLAILCSYLRTCAVCTFPLLNVLPTPISHQLLPLLEEFMQKSPHQQDLPVNTPHSP